MGTFHTLAAAVSLSAMAAAVPAEAQAHCWADREIAAAQVRDMQTMLMVAALRCRAAHIDISAAYDGFVGAQKAAIEQANLVIKQHFAQAGGAQNDYDHFATSLANAFGDDETTEASCAGAVALAHDASLAAPNGLGVLAAARVFPVALPGGICAAPVGGMTFAAAIASPTPARTEPQPVLIALAAPTVAPVAEPVTLPADVVAAMTVMARYQAAQDGAGKAAEAAAPIVAVAQAVPADEAPTMGAVGIWPMATASSYAPAQIASLRR